MNKGEFIIQKHNGEFSIVLPDKKIFKDLFSYLYPDADKKHYCIMDYEGSNTYFGKKYWKNRGVHFSEVVEEDKLLFDGDHIPFVIKDKIIKIKMYISSTLQASDKNYEDFIEICEDKTLTISTKNFQIIIKSLLFLFERVFYLDFSSKYNRDDLYHFLENLFGKSFTCKGHIFIKTLHLKNGFDFRMTLSETANKVKLYHIGFSEGKWYSNEFTDEKKQTLINKYEMFEKINYAYVSVFLAVFVIGILLIATNLRFNIALFAIILILFFSLLNNIYKKVKVIFGFKMAVKSQ